MTTLAELKTMKTYDVQRLMCNCAREIIRREPQLRRDFVGVATEGLLAHAHETLASYHRSEQMCAPELR